MSKNILIINEYAGSLEYGMTFRHYYLAKEFIKQGHDVTIATASYSHFLKKFPDMKNKTYKIEKIKNIKYLWIKVMKYSESFDKKRVFKWFEFVSKLFFISKKLESKPDIIICSPTAPFSILPAYYLAKKFNATLVFEVRDIWPLTLIEVGGFSSKHPLIKLMTWCEKFALNKSDLLISNLQNYTQHIQELGIDRKASWVSNGIDLEEMKNIEPLDINVKNKLPLDKFIVGYTGKLGVSNATEFLIESAKKLKENTDILFVIVGTGQEEEHLKNQASNLHNVIFIEPIAKSQIQSILSLFDVCYIGWNKEKIYKYGVSPNKIFDYMYSSTPIIHSINTPKDIVKLSNCGVSVEAENSDEIKNAILEIYNMDIKDRKRLGANGKEYVLDNFIYQQLASKYIKIINGE
jgi:glycosyltransferase involved in cell wall biosynthesis